MTLLFAIVNSLGFQSEATALLLAVVGLVLAAGLFGPPAARTGLMQLVNVVQHGGFRRAITSILDWVLYGLLVFGILVALWTQKPRFNQGDWYCWDSGRPSPHRLYVPVPAGDHLCTNAELGNRGR